MRSGLAALASRTTSRPVLKASFSVGSSGGSVTASTYFVGLDTTDQFYIHGERVANNGKYVAFGGKIAASVVENHFWAHAALIVVHEKLAPKSKQQSTVVVEGNRRLAAVRLLLAARAGRPLTSKWKDLANGLTKAAAEELASLPTIEADDRSDVDAFLGFRHVTGIKQWEPHEKASFIAKLVDSGLTYEEVMRRIGSKTPTVRRNYLALKLFRQLEELEDVAVEKVRNKFSVLFLSLRSSGTQAYLGIDIDAEPKKATKPLQAKYKPNAVRFARWLFGDDKHDPLFTDSRHTDRFGLMLASKEATAYLERNENPRFEVALRLSGGDRVEVIRHIEHAADEIEEVLSVVQHHSKNVDVIAATRRLFKDVEALSGHFPPLPANRREIANAAASGNRGVPVADQAQLRSAVVL